MVESEEIATKIADPNLDEEERERLSRRYDSLHEELTPSKYKGTGAGNAEKNRL